MGDNKFPIDKLLEQGFKINIIQFNGMKDGEANLLVSPKDYKLITEKYKEKYQPKKTENTGQFSKPIISQVIHETTGCQNCGNTLMALSWFNDKHLCGHCMPQQF